MGALVRTCSDYFWGVVYSVRPEGGMTAPIDRGAHRPVRINFVPRSWGLRAPKSASLGRPWGPGNLLSQGVLGVRFFCWRDADNLDGMDGG